MKHFLHIAFTAALILTGCASDEMTDISSERVPMRFQISSEAFTRFTPYTITNLQRAGITLKITTTDSENKTLYQGHVTYNTTSGEWELNSPTILYWPYDEAEPVRFDAIIGNLGGDVSIDASDHASEDLLICHMTEPLKKYPTGIINLEFSHLFASATVSVKLDDAYPDLAAAELYRCYITRQTTTKYNYTTNTWDASGEQQIYFKCGSDGTAGYVTATSSTVGVVLETTDYPMGGNDAPYLFIPGDYEVTVSYMPYDALGNRLSSDIITRHGVFELEAGETKNFELILGL